MGIHYTRTVSALFDAADFAIEHVWYRNPHWELTLFILNQAASVGESNQTNRIKINRAGLIDISISIRSKEGGEQKTSRISSQKIWV